MIKEDNFCELLLPYESYEGKFDEIQTANPANITTVALGNFDGIHLGHKKLFANIGENGAAVVILKDYYKLTPFRAREKFTDLPIFYFDLHDIKNLEGDEFVALLRNKFPNLTKIVVGDDFKFGKDRKFDTEFLKNRFKGTTTIIDEVCIDGTGVHTTVIKIFLRNGNIISANRFLGRKYEISGKVVSGQGIGKKDLVATINLQTGQYFLPCDGVYATFTRVNEKIYKSVSFIGHRVSADGEFAVESHIFGNFNEENFKFATIYFVKFLRENKKFHDLTELKQQILIDIENANKALENETI